MPLADGTNVNHELLKAGGCWWYRKYASENAALECVDVEARAARLGLWADLQPVPPWEWRTRGQASSTSHFFAGSDIPWSRLNWMRRKLALTAIGLAKKIDRFLASEMGW